MPAGMPLGWAQLGQDRRGVIDMLKLLFGNPWVLLAIAVAWAASVGGGYVEGRLHQAKSDAKEVGLWHGKYDALVLEYKRDVEWRRTAIDHFVTRIGTLEADLETARRPVEQKINVIHDVVEREVKVYVTREAVASCTITAGFVRVLNDSYGAFGVARQQAGGAALPALRPDEVDAAAGIGIDTIAGVIQRNQAKCDQYREVAEYWQAWVKTHEPEFK